ncbi:hypothetical protein GOV10_00205, partial [Candidatus Woesearchaeota archaeon]|nr:hypothetical protein [Candidatus Woesearchaeota archaeon]
MNNPCIETGIDRLHSLIEENNEITLTEAAAQLRVSRSIVEHWSEALEDARMIVCSFSLNEKNLMTKKHHRKKKGAIENMKRQLRLFVSSTKCPEESKLRAREREVHKQAKLIQRKIKELEKYKAARSKVEALIK